MVRAHLTASKRANWMAMLRKKETVVDEEAAKKKNGDMASGSDEFTVIIKHFMDKPEDFIGIFKVLLQA